MAKTQKIPCPLCEEDEASNVGLYVVGFGPVSTCKACFSVSMQFEYLLDAVWKGRGAETELREQAMRIIQEMDRRFKCGAEDFRQELAAAGLDIG